MKAQTLLIPLLAITAALTAQTTDYVMGRDFKKKIGNQMKTIKFQIAIFITSVVLMGTTISTISGAEHKIDLSNLEPGTQIELNDYNISVIREIRFFATTTTTRANTSKAALNANTQIWIRTYNQPYFVHTITNNANTAKNSCTATIEINLYNIHKDSKTNKWTAETIRTRTYRSATIITTPHTGAETPPTTTDETTYIGDQTNNLQNYINLSSYSANGGSLDNVSTNKKIEIIWYDEDQKSTQTVSSNDQTITKGNTFTPQYSGGSGTGAWQFKIQGITDWSSTSYTCSTIGIYQFFVRKLGDSQYFDSSEEGPFTLTVEKPAQPPVSSQNTTINFGTTFWPATNGSAGTGAWQIKIEGQTNWQPESWIPPTVGTYKFQIKKLGDSDYLESKTSDFYTLTVEKGTQPAVTSTDVTVTYGDTFTISASGGITGAYSINVVGNPSFQPTPNGTTAATLTPNTYQFTVTRAGDANWNPTTSTNYTLTVNKANQTLTGKNYTAVWNSNGFLFNDSTTFITQNTGPGAVTATFSWTNGSYSTPTSLPFPKPGNYTYTLHKAETTNYNAATDQTYNFTVTKRDQAPVSSTNITDHIIGNPIQLSLSGGNGSGTTEISANGIWYSPSDYTPKPGSTTFYIRKNGDDYYNDSNIAGPYTLSTKTYNLNITQVGTGNATITGTGTYEHGQTATITITENTENDLFLGWSGDISSTAYTVQIPMDSHKSITATTIDISTAKNGGIIEFGNVRVDESKSITITVTNDGNANLSLIDCIITEEASQFSIINNITPTTLPQGTTTDMDVTFAPTRIEDINGKLLIVSNDPTSPMILYTLHGVGTSAAINTPTVAASRTNLPNTIEPNHYTYAGDAIGITISGDDIDADLTLLSWYVITPKGQTTTVTTIPSNGNTLAANITSNYIINLSDGPGEYHLHVQATDEQNHKTAWENVYSIMVEEPTTTTTIQSKAVPNADMTLWLQESDTVEKTYTVQKIRGPLP